MEQELKIELILDGLDCASCAAKIEKKVDSMDNVISGSLNFITKTLKIRLKDFSTAENDISTIKKLILELEPHVIIKEKKLANNKLIYDHHEVHDDNDNKKTYFRFAITIVLFSVALIFKLPKIVDITLFSAAYIIVGGDIIIRAGKNMIRGRLFDENFLMSIATLGAFAIGEYPEGVAVMLFYQVGEFFQSLAVNRSRASIKELMDIRPDFANLKIDNDFMTVSPEEVNIGDIILVKPGEKIPLDGRIIDGESLVDTSALTGESVPRNIKTGDEILAGFINNNGVLIVEVSKKFSESTVAKVLDLVENASNRKSPTEQFITKFSKYYTPFVVFSAIILAFLPPLIIEGAMLFDWLYRALIFLVISCPCALVVSIPLGFFGGIGGASKRGVLVKGGNYLEALNDISIAIFDKTGTLTKGVFKVTDIHPVSDMTKQELLRYAAMAEVFSNHPISKAILQKYNGNIDKSSIKNYNEISGKGLKVSISDGELLVGSKKLMEDEGVKSENVIESGTAIHIALNKKYLGYIIISDEIKEDSYSAIEELKKLGVKKTVMLTGDNKRIADYVGKKLSLDEIYSELLPHEKVEKIETLFRTKNKNEKLIFIGDGINDAPVLARADIGVAMGGLGSDAAIEAADVVLMTDEPSRLVDGIKIARRTRKIVFQNIVFALGVKIFVLTLGALGIATMWSAVFADVGVSLLAVLNSLRVLRVNNL